MTRLVGSELFKARTTRTALGLTLGLLAIVLLVVILTAALTDKSPADTLGFQRHREEDILGSLGFAPLFALLFGLLASTSEYRHGTMSATLLAAPRRYGVVVAKVIASAIVGCLLGAFVSAVGSAVGLPWFAARGFHIDGGGAVRIVVGVVGGSLLWGALGAGVGSIVKAQVPALIGALAWVLVVESLLQGLVPRVGRFAPGGALNAVIGLGNDSDHRLSTAAGVALTLLYVAAAAAVGAALTQRRDIT
jgi:ABC-2 type transport system permease protein